MANLTESQKLELVGMLACFRKPAAIIRYFRQNYEVQLSLKQVGAYDPQRSYYEAGQRWRSIFDAKRKAYLTEVASVPIANQGYRLNLLNEMAQKALRENKPSLVAQLLKQAAEEVGGVLTNQRSFSVEDNTRERAAYTTPEDRRAKIAELVRQAMEKAAERGALIEKLAGVH